MFVHPFKMAIVDDEQDIAMVLSDCIHDMFPDVFSIKFFDNPQIAFEFIKANSVLIVITDVKMPSLNGDHLNLKIKQLSRGIQTIILTGNQNYTTTMTCFRDGANGYIAKPFEMETIRTTIQRCIDSLEAWDEVFSKFVEQTAV